MSQVVALTERARQAGPGGIAAAAALGRGAALVIGWHRDRLPRRGVAVGGERAARGPFRLAAWAHEEPGQCWFLVALQFQGSLPEPGTLVALQGQGMPDRPLATWPDSLVGAREVIDLLIRHSRARPGDVALFLAELADQAPRGGVLRGMLRRYLAGASTEDGAVEIIGRNGTMMLCQGWGVVEPEPSAIFPDLVPARAPMTVATFARSDIQPPATGLLELITLAGADEDPLPSALYVAANGRLLRRPVVTSPQRLGPAELGGHIGAMLPRIEAEPEALALLGRAARPPFAGVETLSRASVPLAAAIDLAVVLPGIGAYVTGWLADPTRAVTAVSLAAPAGFAARLDHVWTRIARPDVVAGLGTDPRFAGLSGEMHGFAAFVPAAPDGGADGLHLAFELADRGVAYLPVATAVGAPRALIRRIAASIDLFKPTGRAAVEAQLSPLVAAASGTELAFGIETIRHVRHARLALIQPLPEPIAPPAALLSPWLGDPPLAEEESLLLVLGPAWRGAPLDALETVVRLQGLDCGILIADETPSIAEAWEIGARATSSPLMLCLPPAGLVAPPGWRRSLAGRIGNVAAPEAILPTLLYEDGSVRSTGFAALRSEAGAPYVTFQKPFAGLPQAMLPSGTEPRRSGPLAGALVTREAHRRGGGFASLGLRTTSQEASFLLRLGDAGGTCRWDGAVVIVAPESRDAAAPGEEALALAERHAMRSLWCGGR